MRAPFSPVPPGGPPASPRGVGPHDVGRRVRRTFLVVNAVPLSIGVVLSCTPAIAGVTVYGRLTLGVVWVALQLALFLLSTWWYEDRSTRLCEGAGPGTAGSPPRAGTAEASSSRQPGW
ncbi:hypothetical protein GCM10017562_66350 [Streptomyces roseofulvus]